MKKIVQLWRKLTGSSKPRQESSENGNGLSDLLEHDPQRMTYIYGPGVSEGEWILNWEIRK